MNWRGVAGLSVVGLGTLVGPLDTAVNIAFPFITRDFAVALSAIQWVVICYVLTYASLMLACGKLGDLFGHRRVFQLGLVCSAVSFVLCGSAERFEWLLFFRVVQGVGAALVLSCGPALATSLFPERARGRVLGVYAMMFGIGATIGPSLGGAMVEAWGWSAVFWFRLPIALAALASSFLLPRARRAAAVGSFDLVGAGLLAFSLCAVLLMLNQVQQADGSWPLIAALALSSLLGFIGFGLRESRVPEPIVRLAVFRDLDFSLLHLANSVVNLVGFTVLLLVPYFLIEATELSLVAGGLVLATGPLGMMLASPLGGWLTARVAANRIALAGACLAALGLLWVGTWDGGTGIAGLAAAQLLQGAGMGLFQVAYLEIVTGRLPLAERGVAGSLAMVTRTVGIVSGATTMMLVFTAFRDGGAAEPPDPTAYFVAAFQTTFLYAGGALLLFLALTLLRPGIWFGRPTR
ncbi:MAG: MFS transporter [Alphaproteobacteria bacterium]|nr:MFS transporter [Alphaproteobacteria bacterium]